MMIIILLFCIAVALFTIVSQLDNLSKKEEEEIDLEKESPFEKNKPLKVRFLDGLQDFKKDLLEMK